MVFIFFVFCYSVEPLIYDLSFWYLVNCCAPNCFYLKKPNELTKSGQDIIRLVQQQAVIVF